jgi:leucine dehydrogenase
VIDETLAQTISCRVVAGAANNIFADEVAPQRLDQRGIVVAPDFVANAGGAVHLVGREVLGWSPAEVERRCLAIGDTLTEILANAKAIGTTPEASARQAVNDARGRALALAP